MVNFGLFMDLSDFEHDTIEIIDDKLIELNRLKSKYYKTNCASTYALNALSSIINDYPDEALEALYYRSLVYRNRGATEIAITDLLKVIQEKPSYSKAVISLADLYIEKCLLVQGLKKFAELVEAHPDNVTYVYCRGLIHFNAGSHTACVEDLDVILGNSANENSSIFAKALCLRARGYFLEDKYTEALPYIQKFFESPNLNDFDIPHEKQLCLYMRRKISFLTIAKEEQDADVWFDASHQADCLFLKSEILKSEANDNKKSSQLVGVDEEYNAYMAYKAGDAFDVPKLFTLAKWSFLTEGEPRANVRGVAHKLPADTYKHNGINAATLSRVRKLHCGTDRATYSVFEVNQEREDFSMLQDLEEQVEKKARTNK